ncbi:MAG TPA: GNAT family protein [Thermomicrobiales bacterium]|nr:GNAT family protein [Thermomicrobiales bacterium]
MIDEQPVLNIIGERVALGPLRRDLIPLYARWRNDFYVQRTFGNLPIPVSIEQRTAQFEKMATSTDAYWFTIYEKETLRPIGTTDLFDVDFRWRVGNFGIMIGEAEARGQGYGTEATRLMLDYAFTALGLNNVMLTVAEYNLAGRRAYEKAGFKEFGTRRQADIMAGVVYDEIYMDCIASEFDSPVLGRIFAPDERRDAE